MVRRPEFLVGLACRDDRMIRIRCARAMIALFFGRRLIHRRYSAPRNVVWVWLADHAASVKADRKARFPLRVTLFRRFRSARPPIRPTRPNDRRRESATGRSRFRPAPPPPCGGRCPGSCPGGQSSAAEGLRRELVWGCSLSAHCERVVEDNGKPGIRGKGIRISFRPRVLLATSPSSFVLTVDSAAGLGLGRHLTQPEEHRPYSFRGRRPCRRSQRQSHGRQKFG